MVTKLERDICDLFETLAEKHKILSIDFDPKEVAGLSRVMLRGDQGAIIGYGKTVADALEMVTK